MKQTAFDLEGKEVSFYSLPKELRDALSEFSWGDVPKNGIRKALYSALIEAGVGIEIIALIFEHGTNALLPMGPLSFYPMRWIFESAGQILNAVHEAAGVPVVFKDLEEISLRHTPFPFIEDESGFDSVEFENLPGTGLISVPIKEEVELIKLATQEFVNLVLSNSNISVSVLRSGLLLLLAKAGVPILNLNIYKRYYGIKSFVSNSEELHFVALMTQKDLGMGLLPVNLGGDSELFTLILKRIKESEHHSLFFNKGLSKRETGQFIATMLRINNAHLLEGITATSLYWALHRCSNFNALFKLGGMLTAGLSGKLFLPANYYDIGDLLNAKNRTWTPLVGFDGYTWKNPYLPSERDLSNHLESDEMIELLKQKHLGGPNKRGRKRKGGIRKLSKEFGGEPSTWDNQKFQSFFLFYNCWPTRFKMQKVMQETTGLPENECKRRATSIFRNMRQKCLLHAGRPLRFIPSEMFPEFLELLLKNIQRWRLKKPELSRKNQMWVLGGAALGMRISETLIMRREDYQITGLFETMMIRGTKSRRAKRLFPLHLARQGSQGQALVRGFLAGLNSDQGSEDDGTVPFSDFIDQEPENANNSLASVMDNTFRSFRKIPKPNREKKVECHPHVVGRYTHHSLRHATAVRLLQAIMDTSFNRGDMWGGISELALGLGHTLHTFLCSYVGTAVLTLNQPINQQRTHAYGAQLSERRSASSGT